ncbi:MAG: SMC-Scp complex subunit ScpB [Gammaproteobacteria bacterium]|nr:SMC-Scp complex subunit ScpB [Gammaproteobacteria bacterium]
MEKEQLKKIIEGALFAVGAPLSLTQIKQLLDKDDIPENNELKEILAELYEDYHGRGVELKEVASGYRFQVNSELAPWVGRLWEEKAPRYSRALLETLALIAYKQPLTRAEIEEVRGVAVSTNIIRTLMEREWIKIAGHKEVPGHPALFVTTNQFLDYFNLKYLREMPTLSEIKDLEQAAEQLESSLVDEGQYEISLSGGGEELQTSQIDDDVESVSDNKPEESATAEPESDVANEFIQQQELEDEQAIEVTPVAIGDDGVAPINKHDQ